MKILAILFVLISSTVASAADRLYIGGYIGHHELTSWRYDGYVTGARVQHRVAGRWFLQESFSYYKFRLEPGLPDYLYPNEWTLYDVSADLTYSPLEFHHPVRPYFGGGIDVQFSQYEIPDLNLGPRNDTSFSLIAGVKTPIRKTIVPFGEFRFVLQSGFQEIYKGFPINFELNRYQIVAGVLFAVK